jgi:uncharacterized protein YciI
MGKITSNKERLAEGLRLEKFGDQAEAAAVYRKITDKDPLYEEAVSRLLVVYRKLKNYREELALIDRVLAAYEQQDKVRQEKWIREHSKAAAAGTAVFQKLGGTAMSGFGANPVVSALTRRRETLARKVSGKNKVKRAGKRVAAHKARKRRVQIKSHEKNTWNDTDRKQEELQQKEAAAEQRKQEAQQKKAARDQRKRENLERRAAAEVERRQQAEAAAKRAAKAADKKAREGAARKAQQEKRQLSLFVIILKYQVPLEEIESSMAAHMAFLNKHYKKGDFLVSGRQEPRVGGVILSIGRDRVTVDRMMQADPLVKNGLAKVEVVQFKASQMGKGLARYIRGKK